MRKTHHTVHIVTPFDSGGSSAALRKAFSMPAVGDIRARLLALAECTEPDVERLVRLLGLRLPVNKTEAYLQAELRRMLAAEHPLVACLPRISRDYVCAQLRVVAEAMPASMSLLGACIGNMVLAGGYLAANRRFELVLDALSDLLHVQGIVLPVSSVCGHLCAQLEDGSVIMGQHRLTGKAYKPVSSPISRVWLTKDLDNPAPIHIPADPHVCEVVTRADLICYPMGSFYSSIVANLLPEGINAAVAAADCTKVFVPNLGKDPELLGQTLRDQIAFLSASMQSDASRPLDRVLNTLLIDVAHERYSGGVPVDWLAEQGINLVSAPLVSEASAPYIDPELLSEALMPLCRVR